MNETFVLVHTFFGKLTKAFAFSLGISSKINIIEDSKTKMDTEFGEVTEDELNALEQDSTAGKTNCKDKTDKESVDNADEMNRDSLEQDANDAVFEDDGRPVLNNNFILPMEPVDTIDSKEEESRSKKQKREKKDGRFYKFVKKHFLQRRNTSDDVKEIRIVPDGDENKWARRSAGSAASRSSNETTSSDGDRLEVVHDMAEEYIPEV